MSAHAKVLQALTTGQALDPSAAVQLLADLRKETGEQLADAIAAQLDGHFGREPGDSDTRFRKKRTTYGTAMRIVNAFRALARAPQSFPHQNTDRSTS
ncbi:hypothetical protein ACGFNQ_02610 [Streptomyces asoensis]|uniref:hypothetical protein n=1 Tax=Streptomyces asoensis TaxID=249586 RepID=UPI003714EAC1